MAEKGPSDIPSLSNFFAPYAFVVQEVLPTNPLLFELRKILPTRKIWSEKPAGSVLVTDNLSGISFIIRPDTWKTTIANRKKAGFIFLIDSGRLEDLVEQIESMITSLVEEGIIIIAEQKQSKDEVDKKIRETMLEECGLVKAEILAKPESEIILWEARLPKERHGGLKHPVNLVRPDKPNIGWYRQMWREMMERYKNCGLMVIDHLRILGDLHASMFPLRTVGRLKDGLGVTVQLAQCKRCTWEVGLNGEERQTVYCHEHGRQTLASLFRTYPEVNPERFAIGQIFKTDVDCWDCTDMDGKIIMTVAAIRHDRNGRQIVKFHRSCPHCGDLGDKTLNASDIHL